MSKSPDHKEKPRPTEHSVPHTAHTAPGAADRPQKGQGAGANPPDACLNKGCKITVARFQFCPEHYEQFKFGLINKKGDNVPDYEKKWDHYQNFKSRQNPTKVKKVA